MTKKDLENGMIVDLRCGTRYLYCEGVMRGLDAWDLISTYTNNLKCTEFPHLDIVKVYEDTKEHNLSTIFEYEFLKPIWERPKPPKLSEKEIEILKALDVIGFTHIARDKGGNIFAYSSEPTKDFGVWFFNGTAHPDETQTIKLKRDLFSFVDWKDKEPTSIQELLSDFEKGKKDE